MFENGDLVRAVRKAPRFVLDMIGRWFWLAEGPEEAPGGGLVGPLKKGQENIDFFRTNLLTFPGSGLIFDADDR